MEGKSVDKIVVDDLEEKEPVKVSLLRYFILRHVKPQHQRGMAAFAKIREATLKQWDNLFSNY